VSHVEMTADAFNVCAAVHSEDRIRQLGMAAFARAFRHPMVVTLDPDVVRETTGGEGQRVEESIGRLDRVLAYEVMGCVTVIALGDRVMTTGDPPRVVVLHDVAVGAGFRIIGEIGIALRIYERIKAKTDRQPNDNAENNRAGVARSHSGATDYIVCG